MATKNDLRKMLLCNVNIIYGVFIVCLLAINSLYAQYCTPSHSSSYAYTESFSTAINGTAFVNYTATSQMGTDGYYDLSANVAYHTTVTAGQVLSFSHTFSNTENQLSIWVDWNNDELFDDTEKMFDRHALPTTKTDNFIVPLSTATGTYRMRIRSYTFGWWTAFDACAPLSNGQTIDFTLNVQAATACSGTPTAGTVIITPTTTNPGDPYNVSASGYTAALDLTYTWEKSIDNGANWTEEYSGAEFQNLIGKIAPNHVGTEVKYRLKVKCNNSNQTAPMSEGTFTTGCFPRFVNGDVSIFYIKNVSTSNAQQNISNLNTSYGTNGLGYSDYTAQELIINQGTNVSISVQTGGSYVHLGIWIDTNNNDIFESNELFFLSGHLYGSLGVGTYKDLLLLTNEILPGTYKMRIVANNGYINALNPCLTSAYGEAEDYTLIVNSSSICSGTPTAGTITVAPPETNEGNAYHVYAEGFTTGSALSYTWESSTNNGTTWIEEYSGANYQNLLEKIAPATFGSQVFYRLIVHCGNDASTPATAIFTTGYCVPYYYESGYYTAAFSTTVNGTTFANYTATSQMGTLGYNNLSGDVAYHTTALAGETIHFSHTYDGGLASIDKTVRIWVDWNQNGVFEDEDQMANIVSENFTHNGSFDIPANQPPGNYRMRVRSRYSAIVEDACSVEPRGQALDFTMVIPCPTMQVPTGATNQQFTQGQTIADLIVNGTNLTWYSDENLTINLPSTTELVHNTTYYVVSENGNCKSALLTITATDECATPIPSPTGATNQQFTQGQTIADLIVNGTNLTWYSDENLTINLPITTELVHNTTYYVVSENGNCKSEFLAITVVEEVSPPPASVEDINTLSNVRLFPNPTANEVNIAFISQSIADINIILMDMHGKILQNHSITQTDVGTNLFKIDLSTLADGMYSIAIRSNTALSTHKIVVIK